MSRSYRISVSESLSRVIRAEDRVSTQLEVLGVLPPEQMAGLLADELAKRGFQRDGNVLVRQDEGVTIAVNPETGEVAVSSQECADTTVSGEREGRAYDDAGAHARDVRKSLKEQLQKDLEHKIEEKTQELQGKATDRLEGHLADVRAELDSVVNRVTAEALKRKAAQMGQIKEITEDPQAGSLTIVVEV
jgi:hypothetical protein